MAVSKLLEGAFKAIDTANKEKERLRKAKVDALKARDKGMPKPNDTAKLTTARPKMIKDDLAEATSVNVTHEGKIIGSVHKTKDGDYDYEHHASGMSWNGDSVSDAKQHILDHHQEYTAKKKGVKKEDLQELSKKTLGSYVKKAHVSGLDAAAQQEYHYSNKTHGKDKKSKERDRHHDIGMKNAGHTGEKREQGIKRAADKLSKEDLQELSKGTLKSYKDKVRGGLGNLAAGENPKKADNRISGFHKASQKLRKEDTTPLEIDADDSDKEKSAKKKHNDAVKDIKENMSTPSSKSIIEILASGNPQHRLKEATFSVLSQRAGARLDELKTQIAQRYFGQSLDESGDKPIRDIVKKGLDGDRKRAAAKKETKKAKREADLASKARWATDPKSETYWSS